MAKNWMMNEAVRAIRNGDREAILDFGKRFPLSTVILAQLNDAGVALCDALPEKVTMRKIEAVLKGDADDVEDGAVEENDAPAKAKKRETAEMSEPKSWKGMNQYQKKKARALGEEYVAACKALDKAAVADDEDEEDDIPAPKKAAKKSKKPVVVEPEEDDDDEEDEEEEEVVKKPAKKAKKEEKKPAKKSAKKVVEEDDDDDDDFDDFDLDDDDDE